MSANGIELLIDPACLDERQRDGDACAVCSKAWPRPVVRVGRLPDDRGVYACPECATAFPSAREVPAPVTPLVPAASAPARPDALPGAAARTLRAGDRHARRPWRIRLAR
ncbi:hypothetical protein [Spirillospora albida]|uniref:hypothetical protein n=1 Tax=Spirillospora albida TaxID=58123 RepID=UPI0005608820|nr:hypothetical protein [Spirillospora albida]